MNTLTALRRSSLGLDLYLWLVYRTFPLRAPLRLTWKQVYRQFGAHPDKASDNETIQNFRRKVLRELKKIKMAWPGVNLHHGYGPPDPLALEARDCTHDRPTASRGVAPGSPRSDRTRAGCFRWRRDDVPWQSRKPTSERTTETRKIPSGASGGRCAGSSSRASNWTTPIRRARNASSSAEGPLTRPGATNAGRGHLFFLPATAERLRALLRAVFGVIHRSRLIWESYPRAYGTLPRSTLRAYGTLPPSILRAYGKPIQVVKTSS